MCTEKRKRKRTVPKASGQSNLTSAYRPLIGLWLDVETVFRLACFDQVLLISQLRAIYFSISKSTDIVNDLHNNATYSHNFKNHA